MMKKKLLLATPEFLPGRSKASFYQARHKFGLSKKKQLWTPEEDYLVLQGAASLDQRTERSIRDRQSVLGLRKRKCFALEIKQAHSHGLSNLEIAEMVGCGSECVRANLRRLNLVANSTNQLKRMAKLNQTWFGKYGLSFGQRNDY